MDSFLQLFNEHSRKIATAISVVLIILMSISVANTVLFVLEAMNPPEINVADTSRRVQKATTPTFKVSNLELFGKLQEAASVPEVIDAPETKLNLELQGVFIAEDSRESTAIIAQKGRTGELFEIGERLPGNATLAAVNQDHVLIRRGTRMEKLMFSDSDFRLAGTAESGTRTTPAAGSRTTGQEQLERIRDRIRQRSSASGGRVIEQDSSSARDSLQRYKERLQSDPSGTLSELGISPVADGESKGYRVGAEAGSTFKQSGLRPGDVILSVNGRPVGVATSDSALIDQVMASSRVRVEVQRDNRRFFLTVPVPK